MFSPFSGLWQHSLPENYLVNNLKDHYEIYKVGCVGLYSAHCTVMEAENIEVFHADSIRETVCAKCRKCSNILNSAFEHKFIDISGYISETEIFNIDQLIKGKSLTELIDFELDGVKVGKLALYEVLIKYKRLTFDFDEGQSQHYKIYFKHALTTLFGITKIYNELVPDVVIAYSPQYCMPGVAAAVAESRGTKVYFMEGSSNIYKRYQSVRVWDWKKYGLMNPALDFWRHMSVFALKKCDFNNAEKHFKELKASTSFSVYSEPLTNNVDLFTTYDIPLGNPICVVTMSSYDEVFSAFVIGKFTYEKYKSHVFTDQFEWISSTVKFFADLANYTLIIRVHPRTFPSARNKVASPENMKLESLFNDLPSNVRINWPEEKISFYDMLPQTSLVITGWSATAIEALRFGVPVVTYDSNLPSYPSDIHFTGTTREDYHNNILKALSFDSSKVNITNAKLWWAFNSHGTIEHPLMFRELVKLFFGKFGIFLYSRFEIRFSYFCRLMDVTLFKFSTKGKFDINTLINKGFSSVYQVRMDKVRLKKR
jgi:hypothetical protein